MTAANREDIQAMFMEGVRKKYVYMIMVADLFDYMDFPVYVHSKLVAMEKLKEYRNASMSKVMEVYDLTQDMEKQLSMRRAWMI